MFQAKEGQKRELQEETLDGEISWSLDGAGFGKEARNL
jgi:hypothetical protein